MTGYTAGFSGLASTGEGGTKEIAGKIPGAAHYASFSGTADWKEVSQDIIRLHSQGKLKRPLSIFGHSNGGYSVLKIAQVLDGAGIEIDYLGVIDLTLKPSPPVYGNVKLFQEFHSAFAKTKLHETFQGEYDPYELDDIMGKNIGHSEAATLPLTQDKIVATIASLTKGGQPVSKERFYIGKGTRISDKDFAVLSAKHQIPQYLLRAVVEVEAAQKGSHSSGALVFRYELHKAYQYSDGVIRDELVKAGLASPSYKVALKWPHANSYPHLERAADIAGEEVACLASSWGMGQIMGFNHRVLGFDTALDMVTNFAESEANQVEGMVAFIKDAGLLDDLLAGSFKSFAAGYNGKDYARNQYDVKLTDAANKWFRKIGADIDVINVPVPTDPEQPKTPTGGNLDSLDSMRTTLGEYFPDLNAQNRELVLALAMVLGRSPEPPPEIAQLELPTNPSTEAGFSLPQPIVKGNDMKGILAGLFSQTLNFKSKTTWVGIFTTLAGASMYVLPEGNMIADLARDFYPNVDPGTLVTMGLSVIFGREAISKNGLGK